MLRIHCQACERYLDAAANEELRTIIEVRVSEDSYDGRTVAADLCFRCREGLLAKYFGVIPGARIETEEERHALMGPPAMPRFLEPDLNGEPA